MNTTLIYWNALAIPLFEVSLEKVLRCGQTFRWKCINNVWTYSLKDRIVLLRQNENLIEYAALPAKDQKMSNESTLEFINDYFNFDIKLKDLYDTWSKQHLIHHRKPSKQSPFDLFKGIRILRQDPWETTVSFICSSNNNVKRISKMCESLCENFGHYISDYQGVAHYSFPTPQDLTLPNVESKLRELGFGYRARYIHQTACLMTCSSAPNISLDRLHNLRTKDYEVAHEFLLQLSGVGPKVADCICLMALDKHDVVPVDTHVYQIATRDYKFPGKQNMKTMNKFVYSGIRQYFKEIFGSHAGWAQLVLFASDLNDLSNGQNVGLVLNSIKSMETKKKFGSHSSKSTTMSELEEKAAMLLASPESIHPSEKSEIEVLMEDINNFTKRSCKHGNTGSVPGHTFYKRVKT